MSASPAASTQIEGGITEAELSESIAVRTRFGLRADEAWIRALAADPAARGLAVHEFGIPLTPAELADLLNRRWDDSLLSRVETYGGLFPDSFSGAYLNLKGSGVVAEFTRDLERHRRALEILAHGPKLVEVRQVEWTKIDFERFVSVVEGEQDWFAANGLRFLQARRSELEQFVAVDVEAPAETTPALVAAHFGNPGWLRVRWTPSQWTGPRADLVIRVRDGKGHPVAGVECRVDSDQPRVHREFIDSLFSTDDSGTCQISNVPAVAYDVTLHRWIDNDHWDAKPVRSFRIRLTPAGRTVDVVLDADAGS